MPTVKMPDGALVNFPDDMPKEQIRDMIASKFPDVAPKPEQQSSALEKAGVASGGLIEGIPVVGPYIRKALDYPAAGAAYLMTDRDDVTFDDALKAVRQEQEPAKQRNPMLNTGSQIAGGIAGTLPMVAAAPGMFGAGAGPLLGRSLWSAGTGAAIGGADAGVRNDFDPLAMAKGSALGLGIGAAAPLAGQLIGKGVNAVTSRFNSPSSAQQSIAQAVGRDGIDDVTARLAQMGPDAMPMDLGANLQGQAAALAGTPGKSQEIIRSAVANRQANAGSRIAGSLDDALGQSVDTVAVADDIISRRAAAAKPLYEAAYAKPVPFTVELEETLKRPAVASALKSAQKMAANEGIPSQQWFANIADDGSVTIQNVPDVRQLDLTKRALDDMISSAQRGGNNNEARILTQVKDKIVGMVDDAVPEYAAARKAFSGPSSILDALEEGKNIFGKKLTPNQLKTQMLKMGDAEKEAFIQGGRAAVADTMGTARNDALAARNMFSSGYNKEKLEMLVGKEQASKMLGSLDAEKAFTLTRDRVTGNSETFARAQAAQDIGAGAKEPGVVRELLNMNTGSAAAKFGDRFLGNARNAAQQKSNEELARLLVENNGSNISAAVKAVQAAQRRGDLSAQKAKELISSIGVASGQRRKPLEITIGRPR